LSGCFPSVLTGAVQGKRSTGLRAQVTVWKMYEIKSAYNELDNIKILFKEYLDMLDENLDFQNYQYEINNLLSIYGEPNGRLYVIYHEGSLAGCVALKKISDDIGELKRLFIRNKYRNLGLGNALIQKIITDAGIIGYKKIYLDTLKRLNSAFNLYKKSGFEEIEAYYENPLENVIYMQLLL
jgi:GNAT superfamily N-acetyltransferase